MSIFFEFDVGPTGRRFRKAVDEDKHDIELFLDRQHTDVLFGDKDIGSLIELSTLSICMINESKEVVGFMALDDHPNVLGLNPDDWETWIRNMFQRFYLSRNTLFIHFMCCMDSVLEYFMEEACISVFHNDVYLLNIVLYSECDQELVARYQIFKKRTMYKYFAKRSDDSDTRPRLLHVALRQDYCPKLKVRGAVEDDNDDIVKILDKSCPRLKELYGNYYISEIIGRHPESHRKIMVAEYQDHAVGVMCLNIDINYENLQSLYELRPYFGLMKATPLEKEQMKRANVLLSTFGEPIMMGRLSPFGPPLECLKCLAGDSFKSHSKDVLPRHSRGNNQKPYKVNFKRAERKARVQLENPLNKSDDFSGKFFAISPSPSLASYLSIETLMLDEDPFDYEIVNIDKSLLSIQEAFSCEFLLDNQSAQSSIQSIVSPKICRRKKSKQSVRAKNDERESILPLYAGQQNAFMIELFGLRDDIDPSNGIDLLEVAFEVMKKYDYCIIRVPSAEKPFPLLQHFTFVPVKQKKCSEYSLYIAHRASVLGRLRVRQAEFMDIPVIARFLQNMDGVETITTIERSFLVKDSYQAYVFMSGLSLIGIGILEPPEQLQFIRAKYNIDSHHNHKYHLPGQGTKTGFATVKVILVYPVFEVHFRFFAREMMRLSGSNSLIWMSAYRNKLVAHKSNTLVSAMVPLKPRKFEIDYSKIQDLMKITAVAKSMKSFSTWFLDKKLTSVPVVNVNTRIVVIGASRTAMAFLNALLFDKSSTYLRFNNVTLISTYGLPYMRHTSAAVDMMFTKHHSTSKKYLKRVPYTFYVNSVNGTLIEINKQEKYVTITSGSKYYYDLLFIFVGKQYQHPEYLKPLIEQNMNCKENSYVRMDVPNKYVEPDYINYSTPDNVFIVNHVPGASTALKYVRRLLKEGFLFKVVVYGATIHAYCCLTALLEMNVPAECIIFVDPFPPENPDKARVSVFYNSNVDETVYGVLNCLDVEVYRSYYFQSWTTYDNIVTHVEFLSQHRLIKLECDAFFYYGKRGVNTKAFIAVNKCGMAYDGGILIDHQYRTKDHSIYAAGPATAYYRRYFGATKKQKYYDSYEVGEKLGNQIRNQLDPLFSDKLQPKRTSVRFSTEATVPPSKPRTGSPKTRDDAGSVNSKFNAVVQNKESDDPSDLLPNFVKPKVRYCQLPGGLQYLEVRSPGKKIPHHYIQSLHYRGYVMETFKSGYFKLHMNSDFIVDGITCLTCEKYALENFRKLYGQTSAMLNHVHLRYTTKKLDDFFEYFRSPWAYFLYHDQFDELFAMVKELLPKDSKTNKGDTLREALRTVIAFVDDGTRKVKIQKNFKASPYIEAVTDYVVEWLSQHDILLPMYLQPSDKSEFTHDIERDPMFRKKRVTITQLLWKAF